MKWQKKLLKFVKSCPKPKYNWKKQTISEKEMIAAFLKELEKRSN